MKSNRKIKSILFFTFLGIVSLFFINISFAADTAKIVVETANLRENTSSDSTLLKQLSMNEKVEVIEKDGDWYKVKSNNTTGYLRADLISIKEEKVSNINTEQNITTENTSVDTRNIFRYKKRRKYTRSKNKSSSKRYKIKNYSINKCNRHNRIKI